MNIWLIALVGPIALLLAAYGLLKGVSYLNSLDTMTFLRILRGMEALGVIILGIIALVLLAGLVALWLLSPLVALAALLVLLTTASSTWVAWRRQQAEE